MAESKLELKPVRCGCGGEAKVEGHLFDSKYEYWDVTCQNCGINTDARISEADAILAWNRAMSGSAQECAKDARCSDDLISREDAIDIVEELFTLDDCYCDRFSVVGALRGLPSAEPKRKKGEWIKEDLSGYLTPGGNSIYHCSECGHTEGPWPRPRLTDFCLYCGADMRSVPLGNSEK